jgi:hypothetical protein
MSLSQSRQRELRLSIAPCLSVLPIALPSSRSATIFLWRTDILDAATFFDKQPQKGAHEMMWRFITLLVTSNDPYSMMLASNRRRPVKECE